MTGRVRRSVRKRAMRREGRRLVSMLFMLILLGMMISYTKRPATWRWLVDDVNSQPDESIKVAGIGAGGMLAQQAENGQPPAPDAPLAEIEDPLIPGPTDQDPDEWAAAQAQFRDVRDKHPFSAEEMPSYWRLFRWIHAQTRLAMSERSVRNPFFTQIWEEPAKNRGKLYSLKLHVKRVLSHEPEENSAGVKRVYELWGVTDESRSHLYVVLTDRLPEGFPEGARIDGYSVYFTGYFLKILGYEASDAQRGAPLLIGKIKNAPVAQLPKRDPIAARNEFFNTILFGICALCFVALLRFLPIPWFRKSGEASKVTTVKNTEKDAEVWLANPPAAGERPSVPPSGLSGKNPFESP